MRLLRPSGSKHDNATACGRRHVLVHADGARRRADDERHLVADLARHFPPALFPRSDAARGPRLRVLGERVGRATRHGAERVADHVDGSLENRELRPPPRQIAWLEIALHLPAESTWGAARAKARALKRKMEQPGLIVCRSLGEAKAQALKWRMERSGRRPGPREGSSQGSQQHRESAGPSESMKRGRALARPAPTATLRNCRDTRRIPRAIPAAPAPCLCQQLLARSAVARRGSCLRAVRRVVARGRLALGLMDRRSGASAIDLRRHHRRRSR